MNAVFVALAIFLAASCALFATVRRQYEKEYRRLAARSDDARAASTLLLAHRLTAMVW